MTITEAKLAELRGALEQQRDNLRREIEDQGGDPDSDDAEIDVERGFADSAHATAERARTLSVMKALRANLRWVDRAITKMDLGTYGTCERCGGPVGIERLEALPWAILCIDCKRKGEGR
ncbi:MAG TPA: TraR/DksA C4-type zinc finger protein [Actinomycetota bacterium]|nr:TraR/DksA C4-type zinc finger protein [Actinomycetota bacterium]